jgi:hypothetical protein
LLPRATACCCEICCKLTADRIGRLERAFPVGVAAGPGYSDEYMKKSDG